MGNCGSVDSGAPELDFNAGGNVDEIRERFVQAGQGHVFNAWDEMNDTEKEILIKECCQFDVNNIN